MSTEQPGRLASPLNEELGLVLPPTHYTLCSGGAFTWAPGYSGDQVAFIVEAEVRRAVETERERCANLCESLGSLAALDGEEVGSAAMVRVADRMAELCAAAIRRA